MVRAGERITGVLAGDGVVPADAVVIASGGFQASRELRCWHLGSAWADVRLRGTRLATGDG